MSVKLRIQNERIRYTKLPNERLESIRVFTHPTNGGKWRIIINKMERKWLIIDNYSELIAASGFYYNLPHGQREVKKALRQLGVQLTKEKRDTRSIG